ncbi:hypothetical protein [Nocardioides nitrophenolicus]|nr:hypothetical protein [Nocardioides nitrophenolicus]MBM7517117.1 hypothetical protein [Nocardioides nitrophenolicus]
MSNDHNASGVTAKKLRSADLGVIGYLESVHTVTGTSLSRP